MDIFVACMGLLDDTIMALLTVPVFSIFRIGSLALAGVGLFLILSKAARGRQ